jgi:hypothetical protein
MSTRLTSRATKIVNSSNLFIMMPPKIVLICSYNFTKISQVVKPFAENQSKISQNASFAG